MSKKITARSAFILILMGLIAASLACAWSDPVFTPPTPVPTDPRGKFLPLQGMYEAEAIASLTVQAQLLTGEPTRTRTAAEATHLGPWMPMQGMYQAHLIATITAQAELQARQETLTAQAKPLQATVTPTPTVPAPTTITAKPGDCTVIGDVTFCTFPKAFIKYDSTQKLYFVFFSLENLGTTPLVIELSQFVLKGKNNECQSVTDAKGADLGTNPLPPAGKTQAFLAYNCPEAPSQFDYVQGGDSPIPSLIIAIPMP